MVRRLLVLGLGVVTQMSCLLSNPPDYDDPLNVVPVVLTKRPAAPLYEIERIVPTDESTDFAISVRDDNVEQTLRFRWYLDFDPDARVCGCFDYDDVLPQGDGEYSDAFSLPHDLGRLGDVPDCHRVTVVVTDGEWNDEDCGCPYLAGDGNRIAVDWWIGVYAERGDASEVLFSSCLDLSRRDPLARPAQ